MSVTAAGGDHDPLTPEPRYSYYEGVVKIPGYGKQPNRCLPFRPVGFCDDSGHVHLGQSDCETRRCPEHYGSWIKKAVTRAVERIAAYRAAQPDGPERRLLHVVASPDDQDRRWNADELWNARSEAQDAVRAVGVRGGVCIPHPYRAADGAKQAFRDACDDPAGDWERSDGLWRYLRETSPDWSDLETKIEAGPHYHFLAAAEDFDAEAILNGWVVKNVRSFSRFHSQDSEAYEDMVAGMWYLLTHAATEPNRQTVSYFGDVHPATFRPEEELTAAEWDRVKMETANATGFEEEQDGVLEGMECRRDGCDGEIVPIERLNEWLAKGAWVAELEPKQRRRLKGAFAFSNTADRPPPGAQADKERLLEWIEEVGERRPMPFDPNRSTVTRSQQVGLGGWN